MQRSTHTLVPGPPEALLVASPNGGPRRAKPAPVVAREASNRTRKSNRINRKYVEAACLGISHILPLRRRGSAGWRRCAAGRLAVEQRGARRRPRRPANPAHYCRHCARRRTSRAAAAAGGARRMGRAGGATTPGRGGRGWEYYTRRPRTTSSSSSAPTEDSWVSPPPLPPSPSPSTCASLSLRQKACQRNLTTAPWLEVGAR